MTITYKNSKKPIDEGNTKSVLTKQPKTVGLKDQLRTMSFEEGEQNLAPQNERNPLKKLTRSDGETDMRAKALTEVVSTKVSPYLYSFAAECRNGTHRVGLDEDNLRSYALLASKNMPLRGEDLKGSALWPTWQGFSNALNLQVQKLTSRPYLKLSRGERKLWDKVKSLGEKATEVRGGKSKEKYLEVRQRLEGAASDKDPIRQQYIESTRQAAEPYINDVISSWQLFDSTFLKLTGERVRGGDEMIEAVKASFPKMLQDPKLDVEANSRDLDALKILDQPRGPRFK